VRRLPGPAVHGAIRTAPTKENQVLNEPTMQKLLAMKLTAFAAAWTEQQKNPELNKVTFDERLCLLVDAEHLRRENARIARCLREANLRLTTACVEDIDYPPKRELDKSVVRQLASCSWVAEHQNIAITGMTGTGKTYVACALAQQACRKGYRAAYRRAPRLLEELTLAHAHGTYARVLTRLSKVDVPTGAWLRPPTANVATCSKSSKTGTGTAPPSSPASYPSESGMTSSATPPSQTRSATDCSTTLTAWC
jgi:RecG-like helicase